MGRKHLGHAEQVGASRPIRSQFGPLPSPAVGVWSPFPEKVLSHTRCLHCQGHLSCSSSCFGFRSMSLTHAAIFIHSHFPATSFVQPSSFIHSPSLLSVSMCPYHYCCSPSPVSISTTSSAPSTLAFVDQLHPTVTASLNGFEVLL